jgi:hypothetical protein
MHGEDNNRERSEERKGITEVNRGNLAFIIANTVYSPLSDHPYNRRFP